ncbi:hypothetical protein GW17_00017537 [Ensete ventricosum]|nr:hypothetical protein GW17_00017537 [Ensete ventricosum]
MKIWCNRRRRRDRDSLRGRRSGGVERDPESAWSSRPRTKRLALASPFPCPATAAPPRRSKQAGGHDFGRRGCHTEVSCMTAVQMRMLDPTRSIHVRIAALRHAPPPNALLAVGEGFRALASPSVGCSRRDSRSPSPQENQPPPGSLVALAGERPSGSPASVMLDEEVADLESDDRGISGGRADDAGGFEECGLLGLDAGTMGVTHGLCYCE